MTRDDLARFRAGFAHCELVMLADTAAGTVLTFDSAIHQGQERLDDLCATACALFRSDLPARGMAVQSGPRGSRLFLQMPRDPTEVIGAVLGPRADLPAICVAAGRLGDTENMT
ncbi:MULTISPECIES: hypothetical protein [Mameliella]|uniref:hypothetical protein n=1 Tax=Mameliella TaxID=1434019 RepID=UPI000B529937|nr:MULTISPECIES: hypothetical protein [Mameliella]MCR9276136.1 hypothetical protein [Paracoccaceae bacterium]OWV51664.1 hypothetical protein CDZ98_26175 [Mameliella alba]